jgi:hypothetical protein
MPDPERERSLVEEEEMWGRIFPYDHEAILVDIEDEEEDGPEGDELDPAGPMPRDDHANASDCSQLGGFLMLAHGLAPGRIELRHTRRKKGSRKPKRTRKSNAEYQRGYRERQKAKLTAVK